jgi:pyrroloquinoline quinone biosynthesis protein D
LARHVRLTFSPTRQQHILQHPETVVVLNGSGAAILELCDGRRTVAEIVAELGARYQTVPDEEVRQFLTRLVARRCVELVDGLDGVRHADGKLDGGRLADGKLDGGKLDGGERADG